MTVEHPFYAVLLFPQAVETLGTAIASHIRSGDFGPHIICKQINATGPFFEMKFDGEDKDGKPVEIEVMVPHAFIRMVLSVRGDGGFGFRQSWQAMETSIPQPTPAPAQ